MSTIFPPLRRPSSADRKHRRIPGCSIAAAPSLRSPFGVNFTSGPFTVHILNLDENNTGGFTLQSGTLVTEAGLRLPVKV
jgi:hypothetical protein